MEGLQRARTSFQTDYKLFDKMVSEVIGKAGLALGNMELTVYRAQRGETKLTAENAEVLAEAVDSTSSAAMQALHDFQAAARDALAHL